MNMKAQIDFRATKEQYSLAQWAESNLGLVPDMSKSTSVDKWYRSPFRQERTASFVIHEQTQSWYDFGEDEGGDIYELIKRTFNVSASEAWRILTGTPPPERLPLKPAMNTAPKTKPPTLQEVVAYSKRREAIDYFGKTRGLSDENIEAHKLGCRYSDAWYNFKSEKLKRRPKLILTRRDYVIPYFVGNRIPCINKRRDDEFAREQLFNLSQDTQYDLQIDIAMSKGFDPEDLTVGDILDALFRDKYIKQGTDYLCYNANTLFELDWKGDVVVENGPKLNRLGVLAITEGEIDALSIAEYNVPAIAMKSRRKILINGRLFMDDDLKAYIGRLLQNVLCPIVIADNDIPGMEKAKKTANMIGRNVRVLVPPSPYKDANEMHVAGVLFAWLKSNKVIG